MLTRSGDDLFSVAVESPEAAQVLARSLREAGGWLEVVPGIESVAVRFDATIRDSGDARQTIEAMLGGEAVVPEVAGRLVEIPVVYGGTYGPDLKELCEMTGLSEKKLIALHTGSEYTVDLIGFTPGFAFIGGLDEKFRVPRRKEPRQRVAAGSVGIADGRTGLYAISSPGGWNIIGRSPFNLFDPHADEPFVLSAGMRVRFRAIPADQFKS